MAIQCIESEVAQLFFGFISAAAPDPNVYESIDDYAVPRDISLINIPLPDSTEYDDTLFNIDASNSITPNPYATPQQL